MGRPQAEPKHLLDTPADNNIGNSVLLYPQAVAPGATDWGTVIPQTNPQRVLVLTGPSQRGQTTTVGAFGQGGEQAVLDVGGGQHVIRS